jgi:hypothetical protein
MYSAPASPAPGSSSAETFDPTAVRYVKLGPGGAWAARGFAEGIIPLGFGEVEHGPCAEGAWEQVRADLRAAGTKASTASHWTRELRDFYEQDERCLWVTLADGHLHWAFAEPEVLPLEDDGREGPRRYRRTIGGWHRHDLTGAPLTTRSLSSALLRTASYQMTICAVAREDYLKRRIRGEMDPLHAEAAALKPKLVDLADRMIRQLDWRDFEVLTDLVFARGGWQRSSALGTGEVDVDLMLSSPSTGETAWVQIKSSASEAVLDDYLARFERDGSCQRFFFVCHSPTRELSLPDRPALHLWTGANFAEAVLAAGLFDWLVEQTR